jgi:Rrf2 family protein
MRLSKTTEYAIRVLSFMASTGTELYSIKSILDKVDIPPKYLRRIMTDLCKSEFIISVKGRDGGFKFLKTPSEIFIADIIDSIDGIDNYLGCILGFEECTAEEPCAVHESWMETQKILKQTLRTMSLAEIRKNNILKY